MQSAGFDVLGIQADITRQEDVDRLFAQTIDRFGRLDVLVNNAGRSMRGKVFDTTPGTVPRAYGTEPDRPGPLHCARQCRIC